MIVKLESRAAAIVSIVALAVPDMYGRPWAQIWEQCFEQGMERPEGESLFEF